MDNKETGFFDKLEDDLADNTEVTPIQNDMKKEMRNNFEQSFSANSYHKRGFIKDGELIADPEALFIHPDLWELGNPVETEIGDLTLYNDVPFEWAAVGNDLGIYKVTAERPTVEELEEHLLKALSDNAARFWVTNITIYAFAPFNDAAVNDVVVGDYYEFKGRFEFIKGTHGWERLRYNRAVRLPE